MSNLEFGDSDEEALIVLKGFANRVNNTLFDNGNTGLVSIIKTFMTEHETKEAEQEKHHKQNLARLNIIIAILVMIAGYIAIVVTITHPFSRSSNDKVFHSTTEPVLASTQKTFAKEE